MMLRLVFMAFSFAIPALAQASCPPNVINGQVIPMSASECSAWTNAQPTTAQLATAAALAKAQQGIQIVSSATSTLNGTYPIDAQAQSFVQAQQVSILTQRTFTNGQTTMPWADTSGAVHLFPNTATFTAFAKAYGAYVIQLQLGKIPASPVTIP